MHTYNSRRQKRLQKEKQRYVYMDLKISVYRHVGASVQS